MLCERNNTIFAAGNQGTLLKLENNQWRTISTGLTQNLNALWSLDEKNIFGVGTDGISFKYDQSQVKKIETGTKFELNDIWGSSANELYAVGDKETFLKFDGSRWQNLRKNGPYRFTAVWGRKADDVFIAGGNNIWHFNGHNVVPLLMDYRCEILSLGDLGETQLIATTACGNLLVYQKDQWISIKSPTKSSLENLVIYKNGKLIVVGSYGTILEANFSF
jgi:photosystem II stability/assembly factor-like uncharacterized protein